MSDYTEFGDLLRDYRMQIIRADGDRDLDFKSNLDVCGSLEVASALDTAAGYLDIAHIEITRLRSFIETVAKYQTQDEIPEEQARKADFKAGYSNIIQYARDTLRTVK